MSAADLPDIAVISDAHVHDPSADFGWAGARGTGGLSVRPLAEAARSTRVFNETKSAFLGALDDVVRRGLRHVVLLGDYTDDGQVATTASVAAILDDYASRHGLVFYATPGNHDVFAAAGRHRTKRFLRADGAVEMVTSDPARKGHGLPVTVSPAMECRGMPHGLRPLSAHGYFGSAGARHWETPFGTDPAAEARAYTVRSASGATARRLMDASYLVEPVDGLWLLMIDANVFVPIDGTEDFEDSTSAGWNALLRHKPFLLAWIADVAARAGRLGKRIVAFSHYPVLDPLDGTRESEASLLGPTETTGRLPLPAVGEALIAAGLSLHLSGHLHVNDTARMRSPSGFLVNLAVPSLGGFPAAYKILSFRNARVSVETVTIDHLPLDPALMALYRAERQHSGFDAEGLLTAPNYGAFLSAHIGHIAWRRHLKREWPAPLAALLRAATLADIARLALCAEGMPLEDAVKGLAARAGDPALESALARHFSADEQAMLADITGLSFLGDWYRVRMGSGLGVRRVGAERMALYARLGDQLVAGSGQAGSAQAVLRQVFALFERFANGLPSESFSIDLESGAITPSETTASARARQRR